jgi:hypothetical protein
MATNKDVTTHKNKSKQTPVAVLIMTELFKNSTVTCSQHKTDSHIAYLSQVRPMGSLGFNFLHWISAPLVRRQQRSSGRGSLCSCIDTLYRQYLPLWKGLLYIYNTLLTILWQAKFHDIWFKVRQESWNQYWVINEHIDECRILNNVTFHQIMNRILWNRGTTIGICKNEWVQ